MTSTTRLCFLLCSSSNIIIKILFLFFARKQKNMYSPLNPWTISSNPSKYIFFSEVKHSSAKDKIERDMQSSILPTFALLREVFSWWKLSNALLVRDSQKELSRNPMLIQLASLLQTKLTTSMWTASVTPTYPFIFSAWHLWGIGYWGKDAAELYQSWWLQPMQWGKKHPSTLVWLQRELYHAA